MLLIERGLDPALDESQRILSGPLIADLIQKVMVPYIPEPANSYSRLGWFVRVLAYGQASSEIQGHLPKLLEVILTQLSTATKPEFIQVSLIIYLPSLVSYLLSLSSIPSAFEPSLLIHDNLSP